jgi:AcrR family transcriptional regulator
VADDAGVSVEYLQKAFDGKAGLVRALHERSLLGSGATPAPQRSDAAQEQETDAHALMHRFGAFMAEVTPLNAPMLRLIREAAAGGDPAMAALWQQVEDERYERMLQNARRVHARGLLRPDVTAEQAADLFWSMTGSELHERLVVQRGWSPDAFADFIGRAFSAALVD